MARHNKKTMDLSLEEEKSIYNTPNTTLTLEDVVDNNVSGFNANTSFINAEFGKILLLFLQWLWVFCSGVSVTYP